MFIKSFAVALIVVTTAVGQISQVNGSIRGVVTDPSGSPVANAAVEERVDRTANIKVLLNKTGIADTVQILGGVVATSDIAVAALLREASHNSEKGIGREIAKEEVDRYAPELAGMAAVFEPAEHVMFGPADHGEYVTPPYKAWSGTSNGDDRSCRAAREYDIEIKIHTQYVRALPHTDWIAKCFGVAAYKYLYASHLHHVFTIANRDNQRCEIS